MRGLDGIWLGFAKPRNPSADAMGGQTVPAQARASSAARAMAGTRNLWHVLGFTEDGNVLADLQDPTSAYPDTTGVTGTPDRLYVQGLHADGLGLATPLRCLVSDAGAVGGAPNPMLDIYPKQYPEFGPLGKNPIQQTCLGNQLCWYCSGDQLASCQFHPSRSTRTATWIHARKLADIREHYQGSRLTSSVIDDS